MTNLLLGSLLFTSFLHLSDLSHAWFPFNRWESWSVNFFESVFFRLLNFGKCEKSDFQAFGGVSRSLSSSHSWF